MRASAAAAVAAILVAGCTVPDPGAGPEPAQEAGNVDDRRAALEAALETARNRTHGGEDATETERPLDITCEGLCGGDVLDLVAADLVIAEILSGTSDRAVHLSVPGRFWTLTFGADGGLLTGGTLTGIHLTSTLP